MRWIRIRYRATEHELLILENLLFWWQHLWSLHLSLVIISYLLWAIISCSEWLILQDFCIGDNETTSEVGQLIEDMIFGWDPEGREYLRSA